MVDSTLGSDATLPELLAARAHSASDLRLTIDVAGGLAVAAVAALWRPAGWVIVLSAALCFAAFGGWGLADRALHARVLAALSLTAEPLGRTPVLALTALRGLAAVVGTAAAVALVFSILAGGLGRFIS